MVSKCNKTFDVHSKNCEYVEKILFLHEFGLMMVN